MKPRKVVTVLGARPQFVKASVVSRLFRASATFDEILVHTGQHFDENMSEIFFTELGIDPPVYDLGISGGSHGAMTGRMLSAVELVLIEERPDLVLVYGDTNSTLAGALAAIKLQVPVAHVEAGLRSFNLAMPEEVNRILTDRISRWLFAPTDIAVENLEREGIPSAQIIPVGDVMYDVALQFGTRVSAETGIMKSLGLTPQQYVLATIHRAENTDQPERLSVILDAFESYSAELVIVWPVHPRTRSVLRSLRRIDSLPRNVMLIDPIGYLSMVQLEKYAAVIATDSGGVQKEAFFHRVPCVTLRDETEWIELVSGGWNCLAPPVSAEAVADALRRARGTRGEAISPYGDGHAAAKIVRHLSECLG